MRHRILAVCVLLAAGVPGVLFAPVFGLRALVVPIAAVLVACYAVVELCLWFPGLRVWRPLLALLAGLITVTEMSRPGLPTADTVRALGAGVTESWRLTLQSTWPVRPDAELMLFVPLGVLLVAVLGVELSRWPALAVLPSVAMLALSQGFVALSGPVATVAGLGYALVAAGVFAASTARPAPLAVLPTVLLGVSAALLVTAVDQGRQPALSLRDSQFAPVPLPRPVSPLAEVAARLEKPDVPVFSYTAATTVDRWRLVVLDNFDGVSWTATDRYRRLGAELGPPGTVPATERSAHIAVPAGTLPWIPSQGVPASVTGIAPMIDPANGMLLLPGRSGPVEYGLRWWEPEVDGNALTGAAVDPNAEPGGLGEIPPGITELARTATGGLRPSFQTALVLERYLSQHYRVATGTGLPTGSGWPQLRDFLLNTKRGTSEQFAAAYVALARTVGIPARLAVGYRAPRSSPGGAVVVRNADVLAWPEVAVAGVGWVPLDPSGTAAGEGPAPTRLAQVTAQVRADLPAPQQLSDPPLPPTGPGGSEEDDREVPIPMLPILLGVLAVILAAPVGVPLAKAIRTAHRKRRGGARGVVAAWWEARDLLRAHGTPINRGMTARDLAALATGKSVVDGLLALAYEVDIALWSGQRANDSTVVQAWAAVRGIRRGLADRPLRARIRAVFNPRSLLVR